MKRNFISQGGSVVNSASMIFEALFKFHGRKFYVRMARVFFPQPQGKGSQDNNNKGLLGVMLDLPKSFEYNASIDVFGRRL